MLLHQFFPEIPPTSSCMYALNTSLSLIKNWATHSTHYSQAAADGRGVRAAAAQEGEYCVRHCQVRHSLSPSWREIKSNIMKDTVFFFFSVCLFVLLFYRSCRYKGLALERSRATCNIKIKIKMNVKEFEFGFAPKQEQEYRLYQVLLWTGLGIKKIVQHIKWFEMRVDE